MSKKIFISGNGKVLLFVYVIGDKIKNCYFHTFDSINIAIFNDGRPGLELNGHYNLSILFSFYWSIHRQTCRHGKKLKNDYKLYHYPAHINYSVNVTLESVDNCSTIWRMLQVSLSNIPARDFIFRIFKNIIKIMFKLVVAQKVII